MAILKRNIIVDTSSSIGYNEMKIPNTQTYLKYPENSPLSRNPGQYFSLLALQPWCSSRDRTCSFSAKHSKPGCSEELRGHIFYLLNIE